MVLMNQKGRETLSLCRFEFLFLFSRGFGHGIFLIVLKKNTKNRTVICLVRFFVLYLKCSNERDMEKVTLTEKEYDLIMAIRNYKKSYPNGYPEILWYIERLFNELLDEREEQKEE